MTGLLDGYVREHEDQSDEVEQTYPCYASEEKAEDPVDRSFGQNHVAHHHAGQQSENKISTLMSTYFLMSSGEGSMKKTRMKMAHIVYVTTFQKFYRFLALSWTVCWEGVDSIYDINKYDEIPTIS